MTFSLLAVFVSHFFFSTPTTTTEFSQENSTAVLRHLTVDIGPRPMGSLAEHAALIYAVEKFRQYGCDTAYLMPMMQTSRVNTTSGIAVGIKRGATGRLIVIGGHIDSAGPEIPGADDDGSGAAVVLECARVLGKRSAQSTLVFCCFGGEEQGLEGSRYFVDHFRDIDSVALMLQVDMANGLGIIDMDPDVGRGISAPSWLPRAAVEEFSLLGYDNLRYPTHFFSINYARDAGAGSDHESFLRKGIPAIDFSTDVSKPIHTPRDNFENFDPRGLKRSGDLVLRLAERFDHGVPSRETERYWFYFAFGIPIFVPMGGVWAFIGAALAAIIIALISARRQRELPAPTERIRWSGLKVWIFSLIIVACGWFAPDLIGLLRGLRHPWITSITEYYILAFLAMTIGGWLVLNLAKHFRFAPSPFGFAVRSAVLLVLSLVLLGLFSFKLTVEPAAALLCIGLAIILRKPLLKLFFLALSPWWMLRIVFSEWDGLLFRSAAQSVLPTATGSFFLNGVVPLAMSVYILPFLYAAVAVARGAPGLQLLIATLRARSVLLISVLSFVGLGIYLLTTPVYDEYWYREVRVNEEYTMDGQTRSVQIKSPEYLSGLAVTHGGNDTVISARTASLDLRPSALFDTTWVRIGRVDSVEHPTDSLTEHRIKLTLAMTRRPFTVAVTYSRGGKVVPGFDTPLMFHSSRTGEAIIEWYSFPDTVLHVPVEFSVPAGDSVKEAIEVTFNDLADPMKYTMEKAYFIPRTKYSQNHTYSR